MMLRLLIPCLLFLAVSTQARAQDFELSAGWAIPVEKLEDIVQDGVSIRGAYVWSVTDSRNVALLVRGGVTRFFETDGISGFDRSFLGGYRVQPSSGRFWFDLTVGPLTRRVTDFKSKTLFAASIDIGVIVVRRDGGGLAVYLSSTAADTNEDSYQSLSDWTYGGLGLAYRF